MGVKDWLVRKLGGKPEEEAYEGMYYLVFQPAGKRGYRTHHIFENPVTKDDAMAVMTEAGTYLLQKRVKGKIVGQVWDNAHVVAGEAVVEEEPVKRGRLAPDSDRVASAIEDDLVRAFRWFSLPTMIKQGIEKALGGEGMEGLAGALGGGGRGLKIPEGKTLEEYLDDLEQKRHERFLAQAERYGYAPRGTTSGEELPEYEGKFPIWLHPKGVPKIVDESLSMVEKRFKRWGLIGVGGEEEEGELMKDFPKKPPRKREPEPEKEEPTEEEEKKGE